MKTGAVKLSQEMPVWLDMQRCIDWLYTSAAQFGFTCRAAQFGGTRSTV